MNPKSMKFACKKTYLPRIQYILVLIVEQGNLTPRINSCFYLSFPHFKIHVYQNLMNVLRNYGVNLSWDVYKKIHARKTLRVNLLICFRIMY